MRAAGYEKPFGLIDPPDHGRPCEGIRSEHPSIVGVIDWNCHD